MVLLRRFNIYFCMSQVLTDNAARCLRDEAAALRLRLRDAEMLGSWRYDFRIEAGHTGPPEG